ncbi:membrane alanyl aminopeptidase-like [Bicyclus anynana]|uniref:Aminopeptidase n=1 Tax=Bicyclus anynana TaxID=110368 RepID=A0ABM3LNX4_BICAN|nr:membrane alanyl aminopeptidase-like [Bicyclus anynana]
MATMGLKMMAGTCLLFLLVGVAFAEPGDFPAEFEFMGYTTNIDTPKYRLKDTVQPRNIKVDLDVYLSESRFTGTVELEVETSENLTQIVMHQNVVAISAITVLDDGNQPVILQSPGSFDTDSYYEILIINFASTIPPGNYTITISYTGRINENPTDRGFYKGYYHDGNTVREYATTQFQPYHARKAFPCFDEPQFKCPFTIAITRDASLGPTYSNMAIERTDEITPNRIRETFLPTPVISAYLIAFHVSDFIATNSSAVDGKPLQIISRPGVTSQHPYAADMAMKITNGMDEYFDIDYYNMGQGQPMKNDHIALPDFPSGAMENWGMVNYREAYLLYDEEHTNVIDKIFIATILAHELAHKWFGNLVTCFWWSNLWLNESFASYFEHFGAHMADKDLELDNRFITSHVQRALGADASPSINAMNWSAVADNPSISAHFGTSSYVKGASVLRTMEHLLGYTTFRNGLRHYLKDNEYGIGYPVDMYNALRKAASEDASFQATYPGADIGEVLDSWVQTPGSPVVNVYVNMTSGLISLTQERFQLTGTPPDDLWHIPITWTHGGNVNFDNLKPTMIMSGKTGTLQNIPGHHWVILNLQHSGLYRVNYDDHNWEMLANQLRKDKNVIHRLNRAQITNDVLFFLRAGKIKAERAFDVLSFLKDESDYYVWFGPLAQLDWIRSRLEHLPKAHEEFSAYILDMFTGAIKELTYDEKENENIAVTQSRMQILNYACNLGHQGCISDSLNKWNAFRSDPEKLVPKNARRYVYCTGLRQGDASDYNFLFERYNTSQNTADMVVMLRTLACTKDEASLRHYLFQSMHSDKIRIHDRTNAFSFALQGNRENLEIVLDFLYKNFEEIRETYGGEARLSTAISALSSYLTDYRDIVQFQSWLYTNQVALGDSFSTGKGVISTAMNNLGWGNEAAKDVILATRGSSAAITASISLLLLALSAHILK